MITQDEKNFYNKNGYLVKKDLFTKEEIKDMIDHVTALQDENHDGYVREDDGKTLRSINGPHLLDEYFNELARHGKVNSISSDLLKEPAYIHQYKLNFKNSFSGGIWAWHSDFYFWNKEDGMPDDKALTAVIFIDEVTEYNGPMLIVPGSHLEKIDDKFISLSSEDNSHDWQKTTSATLKYVLSEDFLREKISHHGLKSVTGPSGTALFFHSSLLHASNANMTPWPRRGIFLSYNAESNELLAVEHARPTFMATR